MKICIACGKETPEGANFCPACGTPLGISDKPKEKWYFKSTSLVVSFLCVGPFMLPLVWFHPTLTKKEKIIYTIIILALSYLIFVVFMKSMKSMFDSYKMVGSL